MPSPCKPFGPARVRIPVLLNTQSNVVTSQIGGLDNRGKLPQAHNRL